MRKSERPERLLKGAFRGSSSPWITSEDRPKKFLPFNRVRLGIGINLVGFLTSFLGGIVFLFLCLLDIPKIKHNKRHRMRIAAPEYEVFFSSTSASTIGSTINSEEDCSTTLKNLLEI